MSAENQLNFEQGEVLLFDKPFDWSSFDLVKKIRYMIKKHVGKDIKVGHAGTLDPYATGLLILCTGKSTKIIESIQAQRKTYSGIIKLGATTPSYDLESEPDTFFPTEHITNELVQGIIPQFTGELMQLPPIFSAKLINGKRAYELARKGETPEMRPNLVHIYQLNLELLPEHTIRFTVECSKGTYIRSLAHDLGKALGTGGYLASLQRDKIGDYALSNAYSVESFLAFLEGR